MAIVRNVGRRVLGELTEEGDSVTPGELLAFEARIHVRAVGRSEKLRFFVQVRLETVPCRGVSRSGLGAKSGINAHAPAMFAGLRGTLGTEPSMILRHGRDRNQMIDLIVQQI